MGLNFYEKSPRYITPKEAAAISVEIKKEFSQLKIVGVFVNATPAEIERTINEVDLDIAQLTGDTTNSIDAKLNIWRAIRLRSDFDLTELKQALVYSSGILIDAFSETAYGGTGKTADWEQAAKLREQIPYLILAGGLTSQNVAEAIAKVKPDVVDTASGVEIEGNPRRKDPTKLQAFIEAVKTI